MIKQSKKHLKLTVFN